MELRKMIVVGAPGANPERRTGTAVKREPWNGETTGNKAASPHPAQFRIWPHQQCKSNTENILKFSCATLSNVSVIWVQIFGYPVVDWQRECKLRDLVISYHLFIRTPRNLSITICYCIITHNLHVKMLAMLSAVDPNVLVACATVLIATLIFGKTCNH